MTRKGRSFRRVPEDDQEVYLPDLPRSGSPRRVQGVGFTFRGPRGWGTGLPVSEQQWRSVEALVGTVISPSTQQLLAGRGYRLLLKQDSRGREPSLLMDVRHPAGLEYRQGIMSFIQTSLETMEISRAMLQEKRP